MEKKIEATGAQKPINELLKNLPDKPGVYFFKDEKKKILYIGKAKNLRDRVRSYFQKNAQLSPRTQSLIGKIRDLDWVEVTNETEALVLETNLIKEHRPRYNILMRDDKNYLYFKVTVNEDFPRVLTVRKVEPDGARYFGPKTSAHAVHETIKLLKKFLAFRACNLEIIQTESGEIKVLKKSRAIPCLDYHLKRCPAPCVEKISKIEYRKIIQLVIDFFSGKIESIRVALQNEMRAEAQAQRFEKAARLRDLLKSINSIAEKQIVATPEPINRDVIAFSIENQGSKPLAYFNLFRIRNGKLIEQENFILEGDDLASTNEEVRNNAFLLSFIKQYYSYATDYPDEILLPGSPEDKTIIENWLSDLAKRKIQIFFPQRGEKNKLLELAQKNAQIFANKNRASWLNDENKTTGAANELQQILGFSKPLHRIECFDISHLGGTNTVGSMAVFEEGIPKIAHYRHFNLRSIPSGKIDDYASLREVLTRRLSYLILEKKSDVKIRRAKKPELIWIEEKLKELKFNTEDLATSKFYVAEISKLSDNKQKEEDIVILSEAKRNEGSLRRESKCLCVPQDNNSQTAISEGIIGFIRERFYEKEKIYELSSLWVDEKFRHQNIGSNLVKYLIRASKAEKLYLDTDPKTTEFYAELGFTIMQRPQPTLLEKLQRIEKQYPEFEGFVKNAVYMIFNKKIKAKPDRSFLIQPDLILIDGGKGQLNIAIEVLQKLNLQIPVVAITKPTNRKANEPDRIFVPDKSTPIDLLSSSEALYLVARIRDEAHRFAISHQRGVRTKLALASALDEIEGIGPEKRNQLLQKFGSLEKAREAPLEELEKILGKSVAERFME